MIRTQYKMKLPKIHCYPVGAQTVSKELEGVPQYGDLSLWFSCHPRSELVMAVAYTFPTGGLTEPRWHVTVYAVTRELNALVARNLKANGLKSIRNWLDTKRTETWLQASHRLEIFYDAAEDAIRCEQRDR